MTTARTWSFMLLAVGLLVIPMVLLAQGRNHLIGADDIITRANTLAEKKDYPGAVNLLKSALDRYPKYLPLYLALADMQEAAGIEKLSEPEEPATPTAIGPDGNPIPGVPAGYPGYPGAGIQPMPGVGPAMQTVPVPGPYGADPYGGPPAAPVAQPAQPGMQQNPMQGGAPIFQPFPGAPGGYTPTPGSPVIGTDGNPITGWIIGPDGNPMKKPRVLATREQFMKDPDMVADLFETLGRGMMYLDDTSAIEQRVNELLAISIPTQLGDYGVLALPGNPVAFAYSLSDPRLPIAERGLQQGLITTAQIPVTDALQRDPKYGKDAKYARDPVFGGMTFQWMLYAYGYDKTDQSWHLRFRVMWQDVPGKEDVRLMLAQQTAQLLLRLYGTVDAYTGLASRFSDKGVVNVWLTEKGNPGAEASSENLYVYNVGTPRVGMEWVRELAHEYGHLVLPPVGGYKSPEWSANGSLGENLFMRWLVLNRDFTSDPHPWVRAIEGEALQEQRIFPLITKYANAGPQATVLRGTDKEAMDTFVGMGLYLEALRSGRYLAGVLNDMRTPSYAGTNGFLQTLENLDIYSQEYPTVLLHTSDLPQDIPYQVFLRTGTWDGELRGNDLQPGKLKLMVDGAPVPVDVQGKFTLTELPAGWHVIRVLPVGNAQIPDLTLIKLTRE
ncbi:MAG TPA: hypothetical protein VHV83_21850 [Armatimonadota bacterium]|nr:hypothetical protein [Armatimonadota bacterium]